MASATMAGGTVDQDGYRLDTLVQRRRNEVAAKKLFHTG